MIRFPGCRMRTDEGVRPKGRNGSDSFCSNPGRSWWRSKAGQLQWEQREVGRFERHYRSRRDRVWRLINSKGEGQGGSKGGAWTSDWVMGDGLGECKSHLENLWFTSLLICAFVFSLILSHPFWVVVPCFSFPISQSSSASSVPVLSSKTLCKDRNFTLCYLYSSH